MQNNIEQFWGALVLQLKYLAEDQGKTKYQIAKETGLSESTIGRVFSLKFCPTLKVFVAISYCLGVNFFIESKDSDTDLSKTFEKAMDDLHRKKIIM